MNTHHASRQLQPFSVLIVIMDGVGWSNLSAAQGNAVAAAHMPHLKRLMAGPLATTLRAHGPWVGLPTADDMGNSEVGHNIMGAGRIFDQGAKLVNQAFASGRIFESAGWKAVAHREGLYSGAHTLHFLGLFSDGNVHSHHDHLFALIQKAKNMGIKRVRLHLLLDGRDVGPMTALTYVERLEKFLTSCVSETFDCAVASGGGRSTVTMDRYESDWSIVQRGYEAHVLGQGPAFNTLRQAIEHFYSQGCTNDQELPAFVIGESAPGIQDGDSVVVFNFRGDRVVEITKALTEKQSFKGFQRTRVPDVVFAGMMQYDGDLKLPELYLVEPPAIGQTMGELLSQMHVRQFACSETQKFGHVTYFWNGNRSSAFDTSTETYTEIPSHKGPFQHRPWMQCAAITDETIRHMEASGDTRFKMGRINFANGDMVGHTGDYDAAVVSLCALDLQLGRLMQAALNTQTTLMITADHGNADEMFQWDKKTGKLVVNSHNEPCPKTSHTLAPVPFVIFNPGLPVALNKTPDSGLANIAATALNLAGYIAPEFYEPSLVTF